MNFVLLTYTSLTAIMFTPGSYVSERCQPMLTYKAQLGGEKLGSNIIGDKLPFFLFIIHIHYKRHI